ncbi:uncharacterized protein [Diadema antillarum]|uniref:uncharacterized protein n=1 Tax=Diadema antillarum TaxID=105358 RepID=UPI003A8B571D
MFLACDLSEGCRQTLAIVLLMIHIICFFCSTALCAVGFFLRVSLATKVNLIEGYDGDVLPVVLMAVGGFTGLTNLVGSKMAFDIGKPLRRKRLRCLLVALLVLLLVVQIALLTAGIMCFAHRRHLAKSFHNGLIKAMEKFQNDHKIRYDIHKLQMDFRCCGNGGYEDWFDIQWVSNDFLDLQNPNIQSKMTSGQYLNDDVPFSCCRPSSSRPCVHHFVHDNDIHYRYDYGIDLTLHRMGCKTSLMEYFGSRLASVGAVTMALLGLQTVASLLVRYLQTSITTAIEGGDPEMTSPGFLCPGGAAESGAGGGKVVRGSLDDFKAHDLDFEDDDDTFIDDSTFDEENFEEPVYANIQEIKDEPIYANIQEFRDEPIYANIQDVSANKEEPIYANIIGTADNIANKQQMTPPQRPSAPSKAKPPEVPSQRPNKPPQRPNNPPKRPSNPPPQRNKGAQPKTSTPKKTPPQKSVKGTKGGSPSKRDKSLGSDKAKSPQKASTKSKSPGARGSTKRAKTTKPRAGKQKVRSSSKSKPAKASKKMTKSPKTKSVKRSPKRSSGKQSKKRRSKNRNNNISPDSSESFVSSGTDSATESSEDSSSATDASTYDLESGSSSDESDPSSETPLLQ